MKCKKVTGENVRMSQQQQLRNRGRKQPQQQQQHRESALGPPEESDEDLKCDRRSVSMGFCGGLFTGALLLPLYIAAARAYGVHQ